MKTFILIVSLLLVLSGALVAEVNYATPGSVLIYPFFNTEWGNVTILSITNINKCFAWNPSTVSFYGDVFAHFYYVDGEDCTVTDFRIYLSPGDTHTLNVAQHNPNAGGPGGYVYVVAENTFTRDPMAFDGIAPTPAGNFDSGLVGKIVIGNGIFSYAYSVPAIGIRTALDIGWGNDIDVNNNGKLDVGQELEGMPSKLYISDFFEVGFANCSSMLVLLALQSPFIEVRMKYLFSNNDEVEFSSTDYFQCWMAKPLKDISPIVEHLGGVPAWVPTGWVEMWVDRGYNEETNQIVPGDEIAILGAHIYVMISPAYFSAELLHHSPDSFRSGMLDIF